MPLYLVTKLGRSTLDSALGISNFVLFFIKALVVLVSTPLKTDQVRIQIVRIGVESLPITILTGSFTGLALALQSYIGFSRFGAESFIGAVVAMGIMRELGPVLTGLMVTARAGSAMAAELATMRITEQIDALRTLCIDPFQYLIVPRLVAGVIAIPCLTVISMFCGIGAGYFFYGRILELNGEHYIASIRHVIEFSDMLVGLIKSIFFGLIIALAGSYYGFTATGGAQGVGKATTRSVVIGSLLILIANYLISTLLFKTGLA